MPVHSRRTGALALALVAVAAGVLVHRASGARSATPTIETTLTAAIISINTSVDTTASLSLSSDASLALTAVDGPKPSHRIVIRGLRPATTYTFSLKTAKPGETPETQTGTFTTATYGSTHAAATISGKNVLVNGSPFFAIVSYLHFVPGVFNETCPSPELLDSNVKAGIELLIGQTERCNLSDLGAAITKLDGLLNGGLWWAEDSQPGYKGLDSELEPLPEHLSNWSSLRYRGTIVGGPGIYECSGNGHGAVNARKAYAQITALAKRRPVEYTAACQDEIHTPNETWLGIIAGARVLVFYDTHASGIQVPGLAAELPKITTLAPAFLNGRQLRLHIANDSIRAAAWSYEGVTYVAAVNIGTRRVRASIAGLPSRAAAEALWEGRHPHLQKGTLVDDYRPFGVHLYKLLPR